MMTQENDDLSGFDVVWLATDAVGRLAAFVTAGQGPIPDALFVGDGPAVCSMVAIVRDVCLPRPR